MDVLSIFRDSRNARTYAAGDRIFAQGDEGDVMYIVLEGEVDVSVAGRQVETLGPGSILGEMAIIDHRPRSATATAVSDSRLVPVDQQWFTYLVRQTPHFAVHVMGVMAERLRRHMTASGAQEGT